MLDRWWKGEGKLGSLRGWIRWIRWRQPVAVCCSGFVDDDVFKMIGFQETVDNIQLFLCDGEAIYREADLKGPVSPSKSRERSVASEMFKFG